jgi:hypothetical protein
MLLGALAIATYVSRMLVVGTAWLLVLTAGAWAAPAKDTVTATGFFGDPTATFSLTAQSGPSGQNPIGRFHLRFQVEGTHGFGFATVQGPVTCLRVEGASATIGGTIAHANPTTVVGEPITGTVIFFVTDGGSTGVDSGNGRVTSEAVSVCPPTIPSVGSLLKGNVTVRDA